MSTFCLVNGSTQNPMCWQLLVPELEREGHRVVTPSLPVDEPDSSATRYAEVIADSLTETLDDVILIGHSASGMFIPLVPSIRPIHRLIYLAALIPNPGQSIRDQIAAEPEMMNPDWVETCRIGKDPESDDDVAIEFLFHDCDQEAIEIGLSTRRRMYAVKAMAEKFPLEALPDVPSSYVLCAQDRTISPDWSRRTAFQRLGEPPIELPGGHCPYLSRPRQLAKALVSLAGRGL